MLISLSHPRRAVVVVLLASLLAALLPVTATSVAAAPPDTVDAVLTGFEPAAGGDGLVVQSARGNAVASAPMVAPMPFTLLGVQGSAPAEVALRTRDASGRWGDWVPVEPSGAEDGPDDGTAEQRAAGRAPGAWVGQPVWVGHAQAVQLLVTDGELADLEVRVIDSLGLSETRLQRVARTLTSRPVGSPAEALSSGAIVTRAQWGADESINRSAARHTTVRFGVLHHTATSNDYTRAQAPGIVRAIHRYHVLSNGWSDIGYNLLVDRFGTVYEGRAGGVERGVIGAHARNFNAGSFGMAFIGNADRAAVPAAALRAIERIATWKYTVHGLDARTAARTTHGGQVIPLLVGHRDVGSTSCPGWSLAGWMSTLRERIAAAVANEASGWTPVVGDWTGSGATRTGWFRDGVWRLHTDLRVPGTAQRLYFGTAGDVPVVGDWTGDGTTTVGVVRDGTWLLRFENRSGPHDVAFRYGRGGIDHPLVGDWNGDGFDTPGIVRDGQWHLRNRLAGGAADRMFTYGRVLRGDVPLVGDWDGDGIDTPGIVRDGEWHLRDEHEGGHADRVFLYGRVVLGDRPVVGDWNGSGSVGVGVNRRGTWHLRDDLSGGEAGRIALRW